MVITLCILAIVYRFLSFLIWNHGGKTRVFPLLTHIYTTHIYICVVNCVDHHTSLFQFIISFVNCILIDSSINVKWIVGSWLWLIGNGENAYIYMRDIYIHSCIYIHVYMCMCFVIVGWSLCLDSIVVCCEMDIGWFGIAKWWNIYIYIHVLYIYVHVHARVYIYMYIYIVCVSLLLRFWISWLACDLEKCELDKLWIGDIHIHDIVYTCWKNWKLLTS